ncbi:MAG: hypothetical protein PHQ19_00315 [Candidatus Krumholzibacteria bacterium]|nr:hypothetical protein [Candidatus Krumholzibacteria bacterium]
MTRFRPSRGGAAAAAVALLGFAIASCSTGVEGPDDVVDRMLAAYGCPGNLPLLTSYTGKGFMKQLPVGHVAVSHPFDVYQKGSLYKMKTWQIREGMPVDMQVLAVGDTARTRWTYSAGYAPVPSWEVELLEYRFPLVLRWLPASGLEGRLIEERGEDGAWRIRFEHDEDLLTLVVDGESWLLRGMILESAADSSFRFEETYGDYRKVDGIWFPNRFAARFRGRQYYEYLIPTIELGAELPDGIFAVLPEDTVLPPPAQSAR